MSIDPHGRPLRLDAELFLSPDSLSWAYFPETLSSPWQYHSTVILPRYRSNKPGDPKLDLPWLSYRSVDSPLNIEFAEPCLYAILHGNVSV